MKERLKKIWSFLSNPPTAFLLSAWLVTLLSVAGALIFVFIGYTGWFSYAAYALAAVTLAYTVYTLVRLAPTMKEGLQRRLKKRKFTRELTESYAFRTLVFAACSVVINLGFVAFNTAFALLIGNVWYGALAGYYFLLTVLRAGVFYMDKRAKGKENYELCQIKNYRFCGVALLLLDIAMAVAVSLMVLEQKPTKYTEITAIVFATYSVYKISLAIWNIFKARKTQDLQIQSFRNIGLADAAVSLLSLQITLVSTFSTDGESMAFLNAATGACVCLFAVGLGVFMIVQANRKVKEKRENER